MKTLIVLPDELAAELKQTIPARQRSRFISEAVEKQLRSMKFKKILKQTAGTWTDKNHPDMKTQAGINRHLGRIRGWN
jgi:metal-responsive CopG/Arc/MetJ family transcriptional regulator